MLDKLASRIMADEDEVLRQIEGKVRRDKLWNGSIRISLVMEHLVKKMETHQLNSR